MSLALYRKYRPKTLKDLMGQDENVLLLQNAAKNDKFGHAYLFYGPRGTGKTTTARLMAKLLNCEQRKSDQKFHALGEPCNKCKACTEIDGNISLDMVEIDAASNRGIDEIKNLKENIRTAPTSGEFKIYIIDEAHMLTTPAFNALLKTLEEPPKHVVFILATTEYEKIPATITSRTQRFLFKRIAKTEMMKKLRVIADEEKIDIDDAALELISSAAEGSQRDAESLLDQAKAIEGRIDLGSVERLTGRVGFKKVEDLAVLLADANSKEALAYLAKVYEEGHNITQLTKDLVHYFRKALAVKANEDLAKTFSGELTGEEIATLKSLAVRTAGKKMIELTKALIKAYTEIRYSPFSMVPLEIAILEQSQSKEPL